MARDEGISDREAGLKTWFIFRLIKQRLGLVPVGARVRARDPKLLELAARMDGYTASPGTVPMNLKELAQMKVAVLVGCPF